MPKPLDFLRSRRTELTKLKPAQDSFNILIYGYVGTGKSTILSTCRLPIYVISFDPGGTKVPSLRALEAEGNAVLDTICETEDVTNPKAMVKFDKLIDDMEKADVFNSIGTIAIDSLTTFADAAMNYILQRAGRKNTTPQIQDYLVQQVLLQQVCKRLCNAPCDFVLTGHIDTMKDEVSGRTITSLLVPGKASIKIPVLFDEVLLTNLGSDTKKKPVYTVRLVGDQKYKASTRRFSGGKFETYEIPDIMRLRSLAGDSAKHLNPLTLEGKEQ